jgi:TonB family protein
VTRSAKAVPAKSPDSTPLAAGELVVYQKGKVIFHMNSGSTKPDQEKNRQAKADTTNADVAREGSKGVVEASSTTKLAPSQSVWLSPEQAAARLLSHSEPEYPPKARSARRAGNVVLEIRVAEDGSVSSIRTLSGDPVLATAAAEAVRNWRYEPYRLNDRPAQFDTDVTLSFTLPN